jgi:hypothetical protein
VIKSALLTRFNNKSLIADALFITSITVGVVLLVGGLFVTILAASLPAKVSGVDSMAQSIVFVMGQIPGIPLSLGDLINNGLATVGIVSWIIGFDILLVGLGLWTKNKFAKWVALAIFSLAAYFDLVQFLFLGLLGSPSSVIGSSVNGLIVYLLTKLDF